MTKVKGKDGEWEEKEVLVDRDDGAREGMKVETLGKLKAAF